MRPAIIALLLCILLTACAHHNNLAGGSARDRQFLEAEQARRPILDEIEHRPANELWAGDYYAADILGCDRRLTMAPMTGYYYTYD